MNLIQIYSVRRSFAIASILLLIFVCGADAQGIYQFWGATPTGGPDIGGTIYSTDSTGKNPSIRYTFLADNRVAHPRNLQLTPYDGKLYGVSNVFVGGLTKMCVFEYDPSSNGFAAKAIIPQVGTDEVRTGGSLVLFNNELFGVIPSGGATSQGLLFKYDPGSATVTSLFDFKNPEGTLPQSNLTLFNNKLYGLCIQQATFPFGVAVFEFDPSTNGFQTKVTVPGTFNLATSNELTLFNGKLYGTLIYGGPALPTGDRGGILFDFDPVSNTATKRYEFVPSTGIKPQGALLAYNGHLWGATADGGANKKGVLFEFDPVSGSYASRHDFDSANGAQPYSRMILVGNKFAGYCYNGGRNNIGVIFEFDPQTYAYQKTIDFYNIKGAHPAGGLALLNGQYFGCTEEGGGLGNGTLFQYDPLTYAFQKKVDFTYGLTAGPRSSLTYFNKALYGVTEGAGPAGTGGLYKFDPYSGNLSVEVQFDSINGAYPMIDLCFLNNKFYSLTREGGLRNLGALFSFDPASKQFEKLFDFDSVNGFFPPRNQNFEFFYASLLAYNGKLYGVTPFGGSNNAGVLFCYDPSARSYQKKIEFANTSTSEPLGDLVLINSKIYGVTAAGGANGRGVIFEFDPGSGILNQKFDFSTQEALGGSGTLAVFNGHIFGTTRDDGAAFTGYIFEYDPLTNTYSKRHLFNAAGANGPDTRLFLHNNIFYGQTFYGGASSAGVMYSFDPVSGAYADLFDFENAHSGILPIVASLSSAPAAVSNGTPGICTTFPSFAIASANSSKWTGIVDQTGAAIAEINPNGNDLGNINASFYVQNNPARVAGGLDYLNRSITISVQNQPAAGHPVDVRLYVKKSEVDDLINTPGSGVSSVNDLAVYKSESTCSNTIANDLVKIVPAVSEWGANYVLTIQVSSFSTFHIAASNAALPVKLIAFTAKKNGAGIIQLNWSSEAAVNFSRYEVERSADALRFQKIAMVAGSADDGLHQYETIDNNPGIGRVYYRLKMFDMDGSYTFSKTLVFDLDNSNSIRITPNPVEAVLHVTGTTVYSRIEVVDLSGRVVKAFKGSASNQYNVRDLQAGIYNLRLVDATKVVTMKFVKL